MGDDISDFYVHTAQVETWEGAGAYGDVYAAPVVVSCFAEDKIQLVRAKDGQQVVSGSTLYMAAVDGDLFVPDSRVTVDGRFSYVLTQNTNDAPGLNLPEHAAITLK
jgi:hypothetical protein